MGKEGTLFFFFPALCFGQNAMTIFIYILFMLTEYRPYNLILYELKGKTGFKKKCFR